MKVTYNWLKDFVDIKVSPRVLADKLVMAGFEVTSLERHGPDWVMEIEVTPNRPDCLSILGIAREVAAITGLPLKKKTGRPQAPCLRTKMEGFSLQIQDRLGCRAYSGCLIKDVKVEESPAWLKRRLASVGVRPVNNIVDITNYVLIELGQPLHAFSAAHIQGGEVVIRRARQGEELLTIDAETRKLSPEILVIADASRPIAIAGLMGGKDTEVTSATKDIFLECAFFDPVSIRRASRFLGLSSESSYRFERTVDYFGLDRASLRAQGLILEIAGGRPAGILVRKGAPWASSRRREIAVDSVRVSRLIGEEIPPAKMRSILGSLGCGVSPARKGVFRVVPPLFRPDLRIEEDVAEELARIWGYDRIPCAIPHFTPQTAALDKERELTREVNRIFIAQGLDEVCTYSLLSPEALLREGAALETQPRVVKPLSSQYQYLRPSFLHGLLDCLRHNLFHHQETVQIFEVGKIFPQGREVPAVGILLAGKAPQDWRASQARELDFYDLEGVMETLATSLKLAPLAWQEGGKVSFLVNPQSAGMAVAGQPIGFLGKVNPSLLKDYDIKNVQAWYAQLWLEIMPGLLPTAVFFKEFSRYPSIQRDLSLLIPLACRYQDMLSLIQVLAGEKLRSIALIDTYQGEQIPSGFKCYTISLGLQEETRTLTDEEVDTFIKNLLAALKEKSGISIRETGPAGLLSKR